MARDGGGVLLTQAIHTLDLFRSLVGVSRVEAAQVITTAAHSMETEDFTSALLLLGNGVPGTLMATTAAYPGLPERIEVWGSKGSAVLAGGALRLSWIGGDTEVIEAEGGTGGGANMMDFPHDAHRAVLADFVDAIEAGRDPGVTGEEALASQRLFDEILAAAHWAEHRTRNGVHVGLRPRLRISAARLSRPRRHIRRVVRLARNIQPTQQSALGQLPIIHLRRRRRRLATARSRGTPDPPARQRSTS